MKETTGAEKESLVAPDENEREAAMESRNKIMRNQLFATQPSLLSSDSTIYKSYRGLVNLVVLLLVLTNIRLIFENALKYGLLITPQKLHRFIAHADFTSWPALSCVMTLNFFIMVSFACEKLHVYKKFSNFLILIQITNLVAMLVIPCWLMWVWKPEPGSGLVAMLFICAYHLKMISYTYFNHLYRSEPPPKNPTEFTWPNNISISDLYMFILRPTLTYQSEYPTSGPIRWGWLSRRFLEIILLTLLQFGIEEQYMHPLITNSLNPMEKKDYGRILERVLKLAIPNLYVWLIGFYVIFHCWLNICAELTRFGDRLFYKDWWNSSDLGYFWRSWNLPVHVWMKVHILVPMVDRKYPRLLSVLVIFLVSAVYHELIVAVPLRNFTGLAFFGMLGQLPLIALSQVLAKYFKSFGNVVFWISIALGQPFIVLLSYRDYYKENYADDFQNLVQPHTHETSSALSHWFEPITDLFN